VRLLTGGAIRPAAIDAHDLALLETVQPVDQVVVVSHRGTKHRPNEVLAHARAVGARTIVITGQGPATPEADVVLRTCSQEQARTHTVSYLTALTLLARLVAAMIGERGTPLLEALAVTPEALRRTLDLSLAVAAEEALVSSSGSDPAVITGTGLDAVTAQEAALKIKEGTYRWAEGMHTEFALHGTPAVFSASTVGYLIRPAGPDGGRTDELEALLLHLGARVFSSGDRPGDALPFAAVPLLARPLVAVVPFQRLVSVAATRLGASPDRTHLGEEPWRSAILAVEL
jgi:glucosamine--fructose-6-phosphate aminotransferase (isomerizing)